MTNIEDSKLFTVQKADAINFLQNIETESADAVVTDPPYCTELKCRYSARRPTFECGFGILGDDKDAYTNYMFTRQWASECFRILKPGARLFVFCDKYSIFLTKAAVGAACFNYGGFITWCKPNPRPQKCRFSKACEYVLEFIKGEANIKSDKYPKDYHVESPPLGGKRVHQMQKPVGLIKKLLTFTPDGGLVVDPFCGSGSAGVAALELGMRFAGCDLNEKCVNVANRLCGEAAEKFEEKNKDNAVSSS